MKDKVKLHRIVEGRLNDIHDSIAVEEPLEVRVVYYDSTLNRKVEQLFTTMRTPGKDEQLITGYMLSSGLIDEAGLIRSIRHKSNNLVEVVLDSRFRLDMDLWRRINHGNSACGMCGFSDILDQELESASLPWGSDFIISEKNLRTAILNLELGQELFLDTGGYHASCLFNNQGTITPICEDVGRHNAVDKALGSIPDVDFTEYGLMVTSRCSYEIVAKAVKLGCPLVIAFGAATSLAVQLASEHSICLIGFAKRSSRNIYTHPHRLSVIETHAST